jgi:hypothetical protein
MDKINKKREYYMNKIIVSSLLVITGLSAHAQETSRTSDGRSSSGKVGLAVEPMILYMEESSNIRTSQLPVISDDTSGRARGPGFGLKLGGHFGGIFTAGLDGRYAKTQMSDSSYGKADVSRYTVGPTLGVQMPLIGIRLFGTYVPWGEYDPQPGTRGLDVKFQDPVGYRLGVGFHLAMVSLNLEYENLKFRKTQVQSVGDITQDFDSDIDLDTQSYQASLSFPLEL